MHSYYYGAMYSTWLNGTAPVYEINHSHVRVNYYESQWWVGITHAQVPVRVNSPVGEVLLEQLHVSNSNMLHVDLYCYLFKTLWRWLFFMFPTLN